MTRAATTPKVSIGLPVYNGEAHLPEALDSLCNQTFGDFEVLLSDNCSTDATEQLCREMAARDPRFKYTRNDENVGAAPNFNLAFSRASAAYFKWFGHDDVLEPTYVEKCVALLDADPDASVAFARVRYIDNEGQPLSSDYSRELRGGTGPFDDISLASLVRMPQSAVPMFVFGLTRTRCLERSGLIRSFAESDLTLVAELRMLGRFREVPEELFLQRIHHRVQTRAARRTLEGETSWFDPRVKGTRMPAGLRLFAEYVKLVADHSEGSAQVIDGLTATLGYADVRARTAAREYALRQWSRLSLGAARNVGSASLPIRLWGAIVGLRDGDTEKLRMVTAWGAGSDAFPLRLFAALRVGLRNELASEDLIIDWLTSDDDDARLAGAIVASQAPGRFARALEAASPGRDFDAVMTSVLQGQHARVEALRHGVLPQLGLEVEALDRFIAGR